jgi:phage terminase large subunit GpA-like protein
MLTGEEQHIDHSFHPIRERVEALDCRVYNLCLADFWLDYQVAEWKDGCKKSGMATVDVMAIDKKWVLEKMAENPGISFLNAR